MKLDSISTDDREILTEALDDYVAKYTEANGIGERLLARRAQEIKERIWLT